MHPTTCTVSISLTDFIDFVLMTGSKRLDKVKTIKTRGTYGREKDFYALLRERIQQMHRQDKPYEYLEELLQPSLHKVKQDNYPTMIKGYLTFLKKNAKSVSWEEPPKGVWSHNGLCVKLNPEVRLTIKGQTYIIKLHFRKDERLSKDKISCIVNLMEETMAPIVGTDVRFGVLDVATGKLYQKQGKSSGLNILLKSEAETLLSLWGKI
ncbi:hypothetical protein [Spirosoma litoris]